jgi:hypothetical protein
VFGIRIFGSLIPSKVLIEQMRKQTFIYSGIKAVFSAMGFTTSNPFTIG